MNSTRRSSEPSRSPGSKPSNASGVAVADPERLLRQAGEQRPVRGLVERVGDGQVGDGRAEEHGAVGHLPPQVAEDVVGLARVLDGGDEGSDALAPAPVQLADHEGRAVGEEDTAGAEVVGSEVHEGADRPPLPHGGGDDRLVEPVLQRHDVAVRGEAGRDRGESRLRVLRLHGEQNLIEPVRQAVGLHGRRGHRELLHRPLDGEAVLVHRRDVVRGRVAEEDVVAVSDEARADGSPDRASAHDDEPHGGILGRVRGIG